MLTFKDLAFALSCEIENERQSQRNLEKMFNFDPVFLDTEQAISVGQDNQGLGIARMDEGIIDMIDRLQGRSVEFFHLVNEAAVDCANDVAKFNSEAWEAETDGFCKALNYALFVAWSTNGLKLPAVKPEMYLSAMIPLRTPKEMAADLWQKFNGHEADNFTNYGFHFMAEVLDRIEGLGIESQRNILAMTAAVFEAVEQEKEEWLPKAV